MMRMRPEVFTAITGMVYAALLSNLLLVIGCGPLVVGVLVTDPTRSWPLLALVAPLCGPALVGVFAVMTGVGGSQRVSVLRTFGSAWRASFRRATVLCGLATLALVVLSVDIAWAWAAPSARSRFRFWSR